MVYKMIFELKGIDAEIFLYNLDRELSLDEIKEVRKWANV